MFSLSFLIFLFGLALIINKKTYKVKTELKSNTAAKNLDQIEYGVKNLVSFRKLLNGKGHTHV